MKNRITISDIILMDRSARRIIQIESGIKSGFHKIHNSKKTYNRKIKHKNETF